MPGSVVRNKPAEQQLERQRTHQLKSCFDGLTKKSFTYIGSNPRHTRNVVRKKSSPLPGPRRATRNGRPAKTRRRRTRSSSEDNLLVLRSAPRTQLCRPDEIAPERYTEMIVDIYMRRCPDRAGEVAEFLAKYPKKARMMFDKSCVKYSYDSTEVIVAHTARREKEDLKRGKSFDGRDAFRETDALASQLPKWVCSYCLIRWTTRVRQCDRCGRMRPASAHRERGVVGRAPGKRARPSAPIVKRAMRKENVANKAHDTSSFKARHTSPQFRMLPPVRRHSTDMSELRRHHEAPTMKRPSSTSLDDLYRQGSNRSQTVDLGIVAGKMHAMFESLDDEERLERNLSDPEGLTIDKQHSARGECFNFPKLPSLRATNSWQDPLPTSPPLHATRETGLTNLPPGAMGGFSSLFHPPTALVPCLIRDTWDSLPPAQVEGQVQVEVKTHPRSNKGERAMFRFNVKHSRSILVKESFRPAYTHLKVFGIEGRRTKDIHTIQSAIVSVCKRFLKRMNYRVKGAIQSIPRIIDEEVKFVSHGKQIQPGKQRQKCVELAWPSGQAFQRLMMLILNHFYPEDFYTELEAEIHQQSRQEYENECTRRSSECLPTLPRHPLVGDLAYVRIVDGVMTPITVSHIVVVLLFVLWVTSFAVLQKSASSVRERIAEAFVFVGLGRLLAAFLPFALHPLRSQVDPWNFETGRCQVFSRTGHILTSAVLCLTYVRGYLCWWQLCGRWSCEDDLGFDGRYADGVAPWLLPMLKILFGICTASVVMAQVSVRPPDLEAYFCRTFNGCCRGSLNYYSSFLYISIFTGCFLTIPVPLLVGLGSVPFERKLAGVSILVLMLALLLWYRYIDQQFVCGGDNFIKPKLLWAVQFLSGLLCMLYQSLGEPQ